MFFEKIDFFKNVTKSNNGRFMVKYWTNFDKNGVVEKLRSRRVDRHYFCRTRWSYGPPNEGVLLEHNAIKILAKNLDGS